MSQASCGQLTTTLFAQIRTQPIDAVTRDWRFGKLSVTAQAGVPGTLLTVPGAVGVTPQAATPARTPSRGQPFVVRNPETRQSARERTRRKSGARRRKRARGRSWVQRNQGLVEGGDQIRRLALDWQR